MTRCSSLRVLLPSLPPALLLAGCALFGGGQAPTPETNAPAPTASAEAAPSSSTVSPQGDPQQRFEAALKLMKTHQDAQAITAFEALSNDFPRYSGPYTDLGILHARGKQWAPAMQALKKAVAENPKNATAYDWIGIVYRNQGNYADAEAAYQQALKIAPADADAHFNLGVLYDVYLHRPADALKEYRAYRDLGHDDLVVVAWIKGLEQQQTPPSPAAPASAATPADASPAPTDGRAP